jgi:mono/diheme cytochrome c family protein
MRAWLIVACAWMWIMTGAAFATQSATKRESPWSAPPAADTISNPLVNRTDTAAGGRKIFQQRCSQCHGDDGSGNERGPNLTAGSVRRQTDGALFWKISNGNTRTGMPSFSFLPRAQRWQLVQHLRSLAESTSPTSADRK